MASIRGLEEHGQSVWLDDIQRSLIWTGALHRMVGEGVTGLTSNPAIFEKAIGDSSDYNPALAALVAEGFNASEAFEQLAVEDMQWACDVLREVFDRTDGRDGYCSLEVSPHFAHDAMEMVDEASHLWELVGRDNLMIKIPATQAGLTVIPELVAQGINVNVTLLFSVERYRAAHEGYMRGLEELIRSGGDPSTVASVASFFISRIDSMVDAQIDAQLDAADADRPALEALRGRAAIATAKLAYRAFATLTDTDRWRALVDEGARPQRLVWTSTSTKDPAYDELRYVEALVGPQTVLTLLRPTYDAFKERARVAPTLLEGVDEAEAVFRRMSDAGLSIEEIAQDLEDAGVEAYVDSYDRLVGAVQGARSAIMGDAQPSMEPLLGGLETAVEARLQTLDETSFVRRLWQGDGSLFGDDAAAERAEQQLGWLDVVDLMDTYVDHLVQLQDLLETEEVESVVVMGMGGASLAAEVFARTFGQLDGSPELLVLDSTVPAQIRALEADISPEESVFVVASKTGSAIEPIALYRYFAQVVSATDRFVALTDPSSPLESAAMERGFLTVFLGDPEVGHRYASLSPYGLVPAAAMGLDVEELLDRAQLMVASCSEAIPARDNPGVLLGAVLGELTRAGRDKLTVFSTPSLASMGPWIEQLVAESTAQAGQGIVVVVGEPLAGADKYGDDRVFAFFGLDGDDEDERAKALDQLDVLHNAGHPVLLFTLSDPRDLVQEMFRWQVATVTAAHVLGGNPFGQHDVQRADQLAAAHSQPVMPGELPAELRPVGSGQVVVAESDGLTLYADETNRSALGQGGLQDLLRAHLGRLEPGDYVAFTAFIEMNEAHEAALQRLRVEVRDQHRVATTVGFGPRFLHSTGRLHKVGPNTGLFFQLTADDADDIPVPGQHYTFGALKSAQAAADFDALSAAGRRLVRVHLGADVENGLTSLGRLLTTH